MNRWYLRCERCLSIGAVDERPPLSGWHCGLCGGDIEVMGQVRLDGKRLEKEQQVSACDARCTHAKGPLCVCKCACVNHGTGRVVTVLRDAGKVPIVLLEKEGENVEKAQRMEQDVVLLRVALEKGRAHRSGDWRVRSMVWKLQEAIRDIQKARTWKSREKKMEEAKGLARGIEESLPQMVEVG